MNMVAGLVLIAVTVAMIYLARPNDGAETPSLGLDRRANVPDDRAGERSHWRLNVDFKLALMTWRMRHGVVCGELACF